MRTCWICGIAKRRDGDHGPYGPCDKCNALLDSIQMASGLRMADAHELIRRAHLKAKRRKRSK